MRAAVLFVVLFVLPYALLLVSADTNCGYVPKPFPLHPKEKAGTSSWFNVVAQGGGACGYTPSNDDLYVAAVSQPTLAEMCGICGTCWHVTGPKGSATVRVVDYCDLSQGPCTANFWTLNDEPFVKIAGSTDVGSTSVTFKGPVACPEKGDFVYNYGPGVNQWYFALHVGFHRYPLKSVEVQLAGKWQSLPQSVVDIWWYNPQGTPQVIPTKIRINDTAGQSVQDTISQAFTDSAAFDGSVQFPKLPTSGRNAPRTGRRTKKNVN